MYELLYGFTPFKGAKRDVTFENILKKPLQFPPTPAISSQCQVGFTWTASCYRIAATSAERPFACFSGARISGHSPVATSISFAFKPEVPC